MNSLSLIMEGYGYNLTATKYKNHMVIKLTEQHTLKMYKTDDKLDKNYSAIIFDILKMINSKQVSVALIPKDNDNLQMLIEYRNGINMKFEFAFIKMNNNQILDDRIDYKMEHLNTKIGNKINALTRSLNQLLIVIVGCLFISVIFYFVIHHDVSNITKKMDKFSLQMTMIEETMNYILANHNK
jgi:hypothetical protein